MRLDRHLAQRGMSRKDAGKAIRLGRVTVDDAVVTDPAFSCGPGTVIALDGTVTNAKVGEKRYYMLNKPAGMVCALRDAREPVVLSLFPPAQQKGLILAGRLDKDTTGLLIVTDDGEFAHRLTAPGKGLGKTYEARLDTPFDLGRLQREFSAPMDLGGGDTTSPALLELLEAGPQPLAKLTICEGKYHQVKRMFARFGLQVISLRRVAVGRLLLDADLPLGSYRPLQAEERALALDSR